ncbi:TldD/PmbA family protein [Xinfangfangia sp. D13-10-4-6]|uniref:TldD/PmbA family protein n=1 Tax=Pseudogemmobacter hezensis TaxID=2737662 RepID=UPI00155756CF|nr:TldD/PmbA family protein [Pseudogemmobacter hezensis]NPD14226.1 TldD/PmbA family protein [Pseudogemmobacter hezensis]
MSAPQLAELAQDLLRAALKAGADQADALAVRGTALSVDIRQGQLEQAERAEGTDIGLRVLIGQRQACVSASDTSRLTIEALAERAVAMAREAPEDPSIGLATPDQLSASRDAAGLELADPGADPDAAALEAAARRLEASALSVSGITQAEASATFSRRELALAQSNGFIGGYGRTGSSRSIVSFCGAGTAMERDYAGESRVFAADLPDDEGIGRLASERALSRLGAVKPPTGTYPVLYDERIAASLIGHLLGAINGEAVARGASWARDLLGKAVLPQGLSLTEDPLRIRASSSRPFDAEGLAVRAKNFVEDGVLTTWVLDLATARRLKMTPTANAMRGPSAPPSPGTTNLQLTPGAASRDDLIAQMGTGLLVTSLIGSTINPTTGDYSRGASGWWVENGQLSHPVHECTIAGNLRDMLGRIVQANDARPHLAIRVPSILIDGMTIAGA